MSYHKILRKLYLIILNEATNQVWNVKLRLELLLCDQDGSAYKVAIADHLACIVHELLLTYLQIKSLDPLKDAQNQAVAGFDDCNKYAREVLAAYLKSYKTFLTVPEQVV